MAMLGGVRCLLTKARCLQRRTLRLLSVGDSEPTALLLVEPRKRDAREVLSFLRETLGRMGLIKLSLIMPNRAMVQGHANAATIAAGTKRLGRAWMMKVVPTQVRSLSRARQNR